MAVHEHTCKKYHPTWLAGWLYLLFEALGFCWITVTQRAPETQSLFLLMFHLKNKKG